VLDMQRCSYWKLPFFLLMIQFTDKAPVRRKRRCANNLGNKRDYRFYEAFKSIKKA
jgi:hypothetical protein